MTALSADAASFLPQARWAAHEPFADVRTQCSAPVQPRRFSKAELLRPAILLILLASACDRTDPRGREPDPALAPVSDTNARTVKELLAAGYFIVDQRETACDAGPGIACDGFDAVYLGKEAGTEKDEPAEFACPGTEAPSDDWKCRELDPPYVPNGGFRPLVENGI